MMAVSSLCVTHIVLCRKVLLSCLQNNIAGINIAGINPDVETNNIAGINPDVETNIEIAVILISVEKDDIVAVASQGSIQLFKENNRLYCSLRRLSLTWMSMSTAAFWAALDDLTADN